MGFVHLHSHTEFSILDSSNKIEEYVKRVKELGMNGAAITDHGNMIGAVKFYKTCEKEGIKPIIGCEVYVSPKSRFEKDSHNKYYHLVLLAKNNEGYQNLLKMVYVSNTDGYYYKPRVDFETLEKYHEGIICLSACLAGELPRKLVTGDYDSAKQTALLYDKCFGRGNYYMEIQDHGIPEQKDVINGILRIHNETGIPVVATNDCHYTNKEDYKAHDVLICLQQGVSLDTKERMRYDTDEFYVKSEEEMRKLFPYIEEAINNTEKIANDCNVTLDFGKYHIPKFEVPDGFTDEVDYFKYLVNKGFEKRYPKNHPLYEKAIERLPYEMDTIINMGFASYFLIVSEFIGWAKNHDIYVGPGRGSAAGSVVAYCLEITNLCPIKYGLLFERFLNPARVSMPDIDTDFEDCLRQKVKEHVVELYGADHVTQIGTVGTMAAKSVLRDVGRTLKLDYSFCDKVAKMVPMDLHMTIKKAMEQNQDLLDIYNQSDENKNFIDMAMKLEGLPKSTGTHACGVIIAETPAYNHYPIGLGKGMPASQYNMVEIEELGNLKMDFLGLRTLTVLKLAKKFIWERHRVEIDYNSDIFLNDKDTLKMIGEGKTVGAFQLESAGMQKFMKDLKPESFDDIIAGISLYRPGPMDFIPDYIKGKNDKSNISYPCREMEPILKDTYGCIVYQEQVMRIVRELAGFSMARADNVRRAMSKKKQHVIEEERQAFVYGDEKDHVPGCIKNGISEDVANKIYDSMINFAKYAFNKSHAACYAVLSMQTAYLKCHYPVEYMAAIMSSVSDNSNKLMPYLVETKEMKIPVLKPDVNRSFVEFTIEGDKTPSIRFSFEAIKGVGSEIVDKIVKEREENGRFSDLDDFISRTSHFAGKDVLLGFIKSGCFDDFGTRKQLALVYESVLENVKKDAKKNVAGQISLFDFFQNSDFKITLPNVGEYDKEELLAMEKESTGVYITGHPLEKYLSFIKRAGASNISNYLPESENETGEEYKPLYPEEVTLAGIFTKTKITRTKTGSKMAFCELEDLTGKIEVIIFPKTFELYENENIIKEDEKVFIKGKLEVEEGKAKVFVSAITAFSDCPKNIWIRFKTKDDFSRSEINLKLNEIKSDNGKDRIIIYIQESSEKMMLQKKISEKNVPDIEHFFGKDNVVIS